MLADEDALPLLCHGELVVEGRLVAASNTTLRAEVTLDGERARCVYKPVRGERPLWDFPDGTLAGREVSAYLLSVAAGWHCVPPTVLRDGPFGPGACQLWIDEPDGAPEPLGFVPADAVPDGWHRILAAEDDEGNPYVLAHADDERLRRLAAFDVVVNNADRKGGHILTTPDGRLVGVDHGVCFNTDPKLRTVLWGWIDQPLPADAAEALDKLLVDLAGGLRDALSVHLTSAEVDEIAARARRLRAAGRFPRPGGDWPSVPWPPL